MTTTATWTLQCGDALAPLGQIPQGSEHCWVTSPAYWRLRDYGFPEQMGREETLLEHVDTLRAVFSRVRRVTHDAGSLWLNYGDAYAQGGKSATSEELEANYQDSLQIARQGNPENSSVYFEVDGDDPYGP